MMRDIKIVRTLCMLMTVLLLCACAAPQIETAELVPSEATPKPEDKRELPRYETELYFPSSDKRRLIPETRQIILNEDISHTEAALRALCSGATTQSQLAVLQNGVKLDKIEMSAEACNVYFIGSVILDETQWLITRAAVAATVFAAEGVPFVNLYYNQMDPGYFGRPLGAISPIVENLDVYIRNMELEYEAIQKEREERTEESLEMRNATIYTAKKETGLLLAQNRIVTYKAQASEGDIAQILMEEVKTIISSSNDKEAWMCFPTNLTLAEPPLYVPDAQTDQQNISSTRTQETMENETTPNTGVIELTFQKPQCGIDEAPLCGVLTLTITGYLPQLRGIRIFMQNEDGEKQKLGDHDLLMRDMYSDNIGGTVALDYPSADGTGLCRVNRTVGNNDSYKLKIRLQTLLSGPSAPGESFVGFSADDVTKVYITGDTAVVDWRAGFSEKLRALESMEELNIPQERRVWIYLYSIINTLTESPGIKRVWMLENGRKMGAVGNVYLGNALMRNPGLIIETEDE